MARTNMNVLLFAALLLIGVGLWYASQGGFQVSSTWKFPQETGEAGQGAETGQGAVVRVGSYPVQEVKIKLLDALNKKQGVANITVEVIPIRGDESETELARIASNPMRRKVDEAVTDADGVATFSGGWIKTGKWYLYAIRGNSDVYDRIVKYKIIPPEGISAPLAKYTVDQPVYVYRVGSFVNISTSSTYTISLSGLSGPQYVEFDINIGEAEPGKVLKNPVLVLKSPEDKRIPSGGIISLYLVKKSGSDLIDPQIASQDLVSWIDLSPIQLTGTVPSEDGNVYMGVQDSAVYTVKLTFDADVVQPGDELRIILDDLGDYAGQDIVTRDTKATPQILTVQFTS